MTEMDSDRKKCLPVKETPKTDIRLTVTEDGLTILRQNIAALYSLGVAKYAKATEQDSELFLPQHGFKLKTAEQVDLVVGSQGNYPSVFLAVSGDMSNANNVPDNSRNIVFRLDDHSPKIKFTLNNQDYRVVIAKYDEDDSETPDHAICSAALNKLIHFLNNHQAPYPVKLVYCKSGYDDVTLTLGTYTKLDKLSIPIARIRLHITPKPESPQPQKRKRPHHSKWTGHGRRRNQSK